MSDTEQPKPKVKKTRTPEQLEALARAREKALEIRKQNAELRKAEKEIAKHEKEESIKVRKEKVKNYLKKEPVKEAAISLKAGPNIKKRGIKHISIN